MSSQTFVWTLGQKLVTVDLSADVGTARIVDRDYTFRILALDTNSGLIEMNNLRLRFYWTRQQQTIFLWLNGHYYELVRTQSQKTTSASPSEPTYAVTAGMPGTIVQVFVQEGERVAMNQPLLIMESMKMESVLRAPKDATVAKVDCKPSDVVEMGKVLIVLEQ